MQMMSVRGHVLAGIERDVEYMLGRLEHLDEHGLADDLATFRHHLLEAMAAESEEGAA